MMPGLDDTRLGPVTQKGHRRRGVAKRRKAIAFILLYVRGEGNAGLIRRQYGRLPNVEAVTTDEGGWGNRERVDIRMDDGYEVVGMSNHMVHAARWAAQNYLRRMKKRGLI